MNVHNGLHVVKLLFVSVEAVWLERVYCSGGSPEVCGQDYRADHYADFGSGMNVRKGSVDGLKWLFILAGTKRPGKARTRHSLKQEIPLLLGNRAS